MATGTVKSFSDDRGFGFITPDEDSTGLFLYHAKDLPVHGSGASAEGLRSLPEGAKVSYEAVSSDKGPKAVDVELL